MKNILFLLFFILPTTLVAQDMAPEPIQNNDLRSSNEVFSWERREGAFYLINFNGNENHLIFKTKQNTSDQKIANSEAEELDSEFVKHFIDLKYGTEVSESLKNCTETSTIKMRSDEHKFCMNNKINKEVQDFWNLLKSKIK